MSSTYRILHVLGSLDRGGAETMVMNLYRRLDRDRFQFDFVVCADQKGDYADEIKSLGGRVFLLPRFCVKNIFTYFRAWHQFFTAHPEYSLIHGHQRSVAAFYLATARQYGLITVAHSHSTSSGRGVSALVKSLLQRPIRKRADYLFACSEKAGVWLFGDKAVRKDNFFILPNAVDTQEFAYDADLRRRARSALGMEDALVVGHVGSFIPVKNHAFLIDTFEAVHRQNSRAKLLLVGGGPLEAAVKKRAADKGLSGHIIFTGVRHDLPALYMAMDVFVLPSLWEGVPLTAIEAQCAGLQCVLSDTIAEDAAVTSHCSFVPLSRGADVWAAKILAGASERQDLSEAVRASGYDIADTVRWLEKFYLSALKKL
ncbi:glycosyltransferase family 1 protein [Oscillospiraceae bacterium CM]|nr:glycosyltransferase family 1 protein [Oscillospiraceae bacterium CM]